jgi:hypothetical protein
MPILLLLLEATALVGSLIALLLVLTGGILWNEDFVEISDIDACPFSLSATVKAKCYMHSFKITVVY